MPSRPPVYLVEERPNPSTDYFVLPALRAAGHRIIRCDFHQTPRPADLIGASVVLVRYVSPRWARLIADTRSRLVQLIFFMDDDVLDSVAARGMPWRYRFKLARLATWRRQWLQNQGVDLWVSMPYLHDKYATWQPRLILPMPLPAPETDAITRVFYHGSASHEAEIRWLYPVLEAALDAEPRLTFEIIGGRDVYRRYRRLPRTTVVHPMSWPAYQSFTAMPGRHLGLAPLLDRPFNRARSCTKFFDITRAGAVGLYSPGSACTEMVRHGIDGWVVPLAPKAWSDAILALARDGTLRQSLISAANRKLATLK
ncbi:glycosyltransferase family 1 protein [uncultured Thiocystis sp.]|uniref:glycosyltransferase family 1 protein n=1 Tax=uncultured Thiocystis sp. TaxID=1202134 RepID=UPI0025F27822|nr:glycosyltransferase family 1 protein [uncultured Thiocystis sp.]